MVMLQLLYSELFGNQVGCENHCRVVISKSTILLQLGSGSQSLDVI